VSKIREWESYFCALHEGYWASGRKAPSLLTSALIGVEWSIFTPWLLYPSVKTTDIQ